MPGSAPAAQQQPQPQRLAAQQQQQQAAAWETAMLMAQLALAAKNSALDTLSAELESLRAENTTLVALAAAKGVR